MFVYVCVAISHGVHHTRLKSSEVALSVEGKDRRLHQVPFASNSRQKQSVVSSLQFEGVLNLRPLSSSGQLLAQPQVVQ